MLVVLLEKRLKEDNKPKGGRNSLEEEVVRLWRSMIARNESTYGIEEYLKKISKRKLSDYEKEYEEEEKIKPIWLENQNFIYEEEKYTKDFLCLLEKVKLEFRWAYFFRPILYKFYDRFVKSIEKKMFIYKCDDFKLHCINQILQRLLDVSYKVIVQEIKILKEEHALKGKDSEEQYDYFCDFLIKDPKYLSMVYLAYCEMTRILCVVCKNTIDYMDEILTHVEDEYACLEQRLGNGNKLGKLMKMILGQGDTHNNGRTVAILEFENKKIVYKCRNLGIEEKYHKLIAWMKQEVPFMKDLYIYHIYNCKEFGFVEFVENLPCSDENEVKEFYENMGKLLCVLYSLNAGDIHCENVIARKNSPVIIDLETIIQAYINIIDNSTYDYATEVLKNSVIGTALLPTRLVNDRTGESMEIGAMGSAEEQKSPFLVPKNVSFSQDEIHEEYERRKVPFSGNFPILDGKRVGCQGYDLAVIDGFNLVYNWIIINRERYFGKIYELFHHEHARLICKSTKSYGQLLQVSYHPDLLYNRVDREIYLHRIGLLIDNLDTFNLPNMYRHEIEMLLQGDIPIWYTYVDGTEIMDCNDIGIGESCQESALDTVKRKIFNMCEFDRKRQVALINESFNNSNIEISLQEKTGIQFSKLAEKTIESNHAEFSKKLFHLTLSRGIECGKEEKKLIWFDSLPLAQDSYQIGIMELILYAGNAGVALSMLYGGCVYHDHELIEGAMKAINPVLMNLRKMFLEKGKMPCGVFTGLASQLYVLYKFKMNEYTVNCYNWDSLLCQGIEYLNEHIENEDRVDFLSGAAGILSLAVMFAESESAGLYNDSMKLAHKAYQKILSMCQKTEYGDIYWGIGDDVGYAHGSLGIAVSLSRYYLLTKNEEVMCCVRKALSYQTRMMDEKGGYKFRKNSRFYSWCNGITGLLFAKLFLYDKFGDDLIQRDELKRMVEITQQCGFGENDSICHGDTGNINILLYASKVLQDKVLKQVCLRVKDGIRKEFETNRKEHFELTEKWGVMVGVTGIALGLMDDTQYLLDLLLIQ